MRVLPLLLVVVCASAAPVNLNFTIDTNFINKVCTILQSPEKQNLTERWMVDPVCNSSADVKQAIAAFATDFRANKYPVPHDRKTFSELIRVNCAPFYPIFNSVYQEAISRWQKLTPGAQSFAAKWENKTYVNMDSDPVKMFEKTMSSGKEFITDSKALTPADWSAFQAQFPAFPAIYNSTKAQTMMAFLDKLPDDFDWGADPDTLQTAMQMSIAEFVPASNGTSTSS